MTKDKSTTQEIPRVWGALCQDQRTKNKYFLLSHNNEKYKPRSLSHFTHEN